MNGLRLGTPELVRWGVGVDHVDELAAMIAEALHRDDPSALAPRTAEFRSQFNALQYVIAQ